MIVHHPSCTADYPEKVKGELPQATVEIEGVLTCVDCGAFEIKQATVEKLGERIRLKNNEIARLKAESIRLKAEIKNLEKQVEFLA